MRIIPTGPYLFGDVSAFLQEAEAEQREAAKQAKAAAKRAAVEAAAAQRAEEARKRHEFMQQTNRVISWCGTSVPCPAVPWGSMTSLA